MLFFSKMEATGNDFIIIDTIDNNFLYDIKLLSKYLCDRNMGVGADGVIFLYKSKKADFKMKIINKDGTEAEMCGNGIRCLAKYIYEKYLNGMKIFNIETLAGVKTVEILNSGKEVKVDMGKPIFSYKEIPVFYEQNKSINIEFENDTYEFFPISMGNPHVICFKDDIEQIKIDRIGNLIENYKYFPNKTNVEFAQIIDRNNIKLRVWERGVGETLSCGTGTTATAIMANKKKFTGNEVDIEVKGGKLKVIFNEKAYLIGSARKVFEGNLDI